MTTAKPHSGRVRRVGIAVLSLTAAVGACAPAHAAAAPPPITHDGIWLTDPAGRAVITHGVNLVYKKPPYEPAAAGFGADDARFLARHGFTSVRLGVIYKAVEPQPGRYDDGYINSIARVQRLLARFGIYSLIDFHQDLYNERFQGEGFPDWAVLDDGLPAQPLTGFPGTYVTSPGENQAWNNLWRNAPAADGAGLQDHYAAAWEHVASRFTDAPGVLGYDIINEPWPGSQFLTCASTQGCPIFESQFLEPMESKAIDAIRTVDARHLVWYEPVVTTQFGTEYNIPDTGDERAGMSFHTYCLTQAVGGGTVGGATCPSLESLSLANARSRAEANGDAILLSEWGATDDVATIERMTDLADADMISWQWWHYCACDDPTTSGAGAAQAIVVDPAKPPKGDNVLRDKLTLIERPYPQAVAGTPIAYSYDRDTGAFTLAYSTTAPGGNRLPARTETNIYVPRINFPYGYATRVAGGRVTSERGASTLSVRRSPGSAQVSVTIKPR